MAYNMYMTNCGVYQIKNTVTGDYYIGSASNITRRFAEHRRCLKNNTHCNPHLQRSWNKHGKQSFEFKVLLLCGVECKLYFEQKFLDLFKPAFNIATCAAAPMQGRHCTKETKYKIGVVHKDKPLSEEHKRKLSNSHLGQSRPCSEETKRKMSASNKGQRRTEESKKKMSDSRQGIPGYWLGKCRDEETKAKISASQKLRLAKENL